MRIVSLNAGSEFPHLRANAVLIRDQGLVVVVDCGGWNNAESIQRELAQEGILPSHVGLLVLTHLHFDHCENIDLFHNAKIIVHWKEVEFLERLLSATTGDEIKAQVTSHYEHIHGFYLRMICQRIMNYREQYNKILEDRGRLSLVDDDTFVVDKLTMIETSGHSVKHMSVQVVLKRPVWIAGDAIISLNGLNQPNQGKQQICWNVQKQRASADRIVARGGVVIPGHGGPFDLNSRTPVCFEEFG